jgi:hypothetical protein
MACQQFLRQRIGHRPGQRVGAQERHGVRLDHFIPQLFHTVGGFWIGLPNQIHHLAENPHGTWAAHGFCFFDQATDFRLKGEFIQGALIQEAGE